MGLVEKGGFLISTRPKARLRDTSIRVMGSASAKFSSEGLKEAGVLHIHSTNTTCAFTLTSKVNTHLQGQSYHLHNHPHETHTRPEAQRGE